MDGLTQERGVESGHYTQGSEVVVYLNQAGVCILRVRVSLLAELAGGGLVSVEKLRKASKRVRSEHRVVQSDK